MNVLNDQFDVCFIIIFTILLHHGSTLTNLHTGYQT